MRQCQDFSAYTGDTSETTVTVLLATASACILFTLLSVFCYHGHSCQNGCCYLGLLDTVIILIFHFHFLVFCWTDSYEVNFWETGSRLRRERCHKSNLLLSLVLTVLHALLCSLQSEFVSFLLYLKFTKIRSKLKVCQKYTSLLNTRTFVNCKITSHHCCIVVT